MANFKNPRGGPCNTLFKYIFEYIYMYVCMDVCMYVWMDVCMDVCMYDIVYIHYIVSTYPTYNWYLWGNDSIYVYIIYLMKKVSGCHPLS